MNVLTLSSVNAAPWGAPLLQDINLSLEAGEILGIIGPNGAGKTSLLKLITGDILPSRGEVNLLGVPLSAWKNRSRARVLATLPQLSLLDFPYTVEEVIMLGRSPHSTGQGEDREILQEVMQASDISHLRQRIYTQLSGGEKQRVQLARVFAQIWRSERAQPRLLLLDEPTAALDLAHQQLILESLRKLSASGCAIVLVAHDFNLVAAIATHVIALDGGRCFKQGTPKQVFTPDIFHHVFNVEVAVNEHPVSGRPLVISL